MQDDSFELHDLRVEVVVPEQARVLCGARPGDHFELRGEMLHLPPGQGFSIYSLAAVLPLLAAKQRPTHPNDWMTSDAEVACPDLPDPAAHHAPRPASLQPRRNHGGAAAAQGELTCPSRPSNSPPAIASRASCAADGSSPAATVRSIASAPSATCSPSSMRA
jgi:uncharacterized repeat protein (TIGR04076 family)